MSDDGGIPVPLESLPFLDEIQRRGGCIIRYSVSVPGPGLFLVPFASMKAESIEWLETPVHLPHEQ